MILKTKCKSKNSKKKLIHSCINTKQNDKKDKMHHDGLLNRNQTETSWEFTTLQKYYIFQILMKNAATLIATCITATAQHYAEAPARKDRLEGAVITVTFLGWLRLPSANVSF